MGTRGMQLITNRKQAGHKNVQGYIGVIFVAFAAALVLKTFVVTAIEVPSSSMETTLLPGDCVVVNKLVYGAKFPKRFSFSLAGQSLSLPRLRDIGRGDVIVFEFPGN